MIRGQEALLSLPLGLKQKICEYGSAKDVLALSSTCSSIRNELNVSVLRTPFELIYSQLYNGSAVYDDDTTSPTTRLKESCPIRVGLSIPIFYTTYCHSIRLTGLWHDEGLWSEGAKIFVVAQQKNTGNILQEDPKTLIVNDQGHSGTIIWQSSTPRQLDMTFCCDSRCDYFMWYQCPGQGHLLMVEFLCIHSVLIWDDELRTRTNAYVKCMRLDAELEKGEDFTWDNDRIVQHTHDYDPPAFSFLAQLFSLCVDLLVSCFDRLGDLPSKTSRLYPVSSFLATTEAGKDGSVSYSALMSLQAISDIFLLLVGKNLPQGDDVRICLGNNTGSNESSVLIVPPILLRGAVRWNTTHHHFSHSPSLPRVIARIPVIPGTERFRITAKVDVPSEPILEFRLGSSDTELHPSPSFASVFVVVTPEAAQQRGTFQSALYKDRLLEHGYHQALQTSASSWNLGQPLVVDKDAIGYYLCVYPEASFRFSALELENVNVSLEIANDQVSPEDIFEQFFGLLGVQEDQTTMESMFHLKLLRAVALELQLWLDPNHRRRTGSDALSALLNFLIEEGFASQKLGLECLVEVIDCILHHRRILEQPKPEEHGDQILRAYEAM